MRVCGISKQDSEQLIQEANLFFGDKPECIALHVTRNKEMIRDIFKAGADDTSLADLFKLPHDLKTGDVVKFVGPNKTCLCGRVTREVGEKIWISVKRHNFVISKKLCVKK